MTFFFVGLALWHTLTIVHRLWWNIQPGMLRWKFVLLIILTNLCNSIINGEPTFHAELWMLPTLINQEEGNHQDHTSKSHCNINLEMEGEDQKVWSKFGVLSKKCTGSSSALFIWEDSCNCLPLTKSHSWSPIW